MSRCRRVQTSGVDENKEPNPWQTRVGITRYLSQVEGGVNVEYLQALAASPVYATLKPHILVVRRAFRRRVQQARAITSIEKLASSILIRDCRALGHCGWLGITPSYDRVSHPYI